MSAPRTSGNWDQCGTWPPRMHSRCTIGRWTSVMTTGARGGLSDANPVGRCGFGCGAGFAGFFVGFAGFFFGGGRGLGSGRL